LPDPTPRHVIEVADGFWNIRGSFKIGGVLDIGTHASLVRRANGSFVLLDACAFPDAIARWLNEKTRGGEALDAILHLHPFHTIHVRAAHALFPSAKLYGTARHHETLADLKWEALRTEDPELHQHFAEDFEFSVPRGADFVSKDPNLHFSSVLAIHRASKTLHVDDTLIYMRLPWLLRLFAGDVFRLHPTLAKVLEPRAGAAEEFRVWARELVERAKDIENLCAAHSAVLLGGKNEGAPIAARIEAAVQKAEPVLADHERKHAGQVTRRLN
jgi:hypothetical protein